MTAPCTYTRPVLDYKTLKTAYQLNKELERQTLFPPKTLTLDKIRSLSLTDLLAHPIALSYCIVEKLPFKALALFTLRHSSWIDTPTLHWRLTPLHFAVMINDVETAGELLEAGASTDVKDHRGMTPLHHAAVIGDEAMIKLLLSKGANADATDNREQPIRII